MKPSTPLIKYFISRGLILFLTSLLACSSGSSETTDDDAPDSENSDDVTIEIFSDELSLTVSGVSEETECLVLGIDGRELGNGPAGLVTYEVGTEEVVIIDCGEFSGVAGVGDESVTLSEVTTAAAESLSSAKGDLGDGTLLIAAILEDIEEEFGDEVESLATRPSFVASGSFAEEIIDALLEFLEALKELKRPKEASQLKAFVIKILINSGQAVVIDHIGPGETIEECSDDAVSSFSRFAVAESASAIDMTGCLVYHSLDAITDKNNPLGAPADNIPESFRSIASESGVIQELIDSYTDNRLFTLEDLHEFMFTTLGHTDYSQSEEGVISTETVSVEDMRSFLTESLSNIILAKGRLTDYRFHVGYNPSGGWEINAAAELQSLPAACSDSSPDTTCLVSPKRFSVASDGSLSANSDGAYILRLEWNGTNFLTSANLIHVETGKPYRNSLYQVESFEINPDDYSAIDYANPLYIGGHPDDGGLDPWCDEDSNCAPFSNSVWRALYPTYDYVDNAYLFPTPEIVGKHLPLISLLNFKDHGQEDENDLTFKKLSSLEVYALLKFFTRALSALLIDDGEQPVFLVDHEYTVKEWEELATTWLKGGTPTTRLWAGGGMTLRNNSLSISSSKCWTILGGLENCRISSTLTFDPKSASEINGEIHYTLSGDLMVESTSINQTYSPTLLMITSNNRARLAGDPNLSFGFKGGNLDDKIEDGRTIKASYDLISLQD